MLAASLGLSRMYRDDLEQLEAGMLLYDAFYRWCRDATEETHNWPAGAEAGMRRRMTIAAVDKAGREAARPPCRPLPTFARSR